MSSMTDLTARQYSAPPREMGLASAEALSAFYTQYSARVLDLATAKLRQVDADVDTELAGDVAAEVWLTVAGLAATGALPGPRRIADALVQIVTAVVTDMHPCDRREHSAGLMHHLVADDITADPAHLATSRVDAVGYLPVPRPLRPAATSIAFAELHALPLAG